jgi:rhamnose transport system permease protein
MNIVRRMRPEQLRELVLVGLIVGMLLFFGTQIENYFSARFFVRISTSVAVLAVVAVGQTLVLLTKNVDLSVGAVVGFAAYFVGTQLTLHPALPPWAALLVAVGLGALMGTLNALLVAYGRVPAIITTLGTLALYRTLIVVYSDSKPITTNQLPDWVAEELPRANLISIGDFDLRWLFIFALIVVLAFQFVLSYTRWGRRLYAIGSNPDASKMAGIPAQRTTFLAFVICGALAGLGGFMFLSRYGNITVLAAQGMELQVVAGAVVGGVSINGGTGTAIGAMLGVVLIDVLEQSLLRWLEISEFWRDAILGGLILLAVAVDAVVMNRLRALWARRAMESYSEGPAGVQRAQPAKP